MNKPDNNSMHSDPESSRLHKFKRIEAISSVKWLTAFRAGDAPVRPCRRMTHQSGQIQEEEAIENGYNFTTDRRTFMSIQPGMTPPSAPIPSRPSRRARRPRRSCGTPTMWVADPPHIPPLQQLVLGHLMILLLAPIGCGRTASNSPQYNVHSPCPEAPCQPSTAVTTPNELIEVISRLEWKDKGFRHSGCLASPSRELDVQGKIVVDISQVHPPTCPSSRCGRKWFDLQHSPSGVTCLKKVDLNANTILDCTKIAIHDATVRLRALWSVTPLILNTRDAVVQVLPSCSHACSGSEHHCAPENTCWKYTYSFCLHCMVLTDGECACLSPDTKKSEPDGTACRRSCPSTVCDGVCQNGLCQ